MARKTIDMSEAIKCVGTIQKIIFQKENFAIMAVRILSVTEGTLENYGKEITIKGTISMPMYGVNYLFTINPLEDSAYGKQYEILFATPDMASGNVEIADKRAFLSQIFAPTYVEILCKNYSDPTAILESEDVNSLTALKGIGVKKALVLIQKYKENKKYFLGYAKLSQYGLTNELIKKLVNTYGSAEIAVNTVVNDPYILADDIDGIGWTKADTIALSTGMHPHDPKRIKAYVKYFLESCAQEGISYVAPTALMENITFNIGEGLDRTHLKNVLHEMSDARILWHNEDATRFGLWKYFDLENNVATELVRLAHSTAEFPVDHEACEQEIKELENQQGWEFTRQQKDGIKLAIESPVVVITGLGGTGKSATVAGLLKVLKGYSFAQCALAGRAAARLAEITGEDGKTIHRLLKYDAITNSFQHDEKNPLPYSIIIVDEISMIGGSLFHSLLKAIDNESKLILIGDIGQLESIGVLNVASDIINSGVIPVINLTEIHRQAKKSAIIMESVGVRTNKQIIEKGFTGSDIRGELKDLELDIYSDRTQTVSKVVAQFKLNLPKVDDIFDIQVIVPMRSMVYKINLELQEVCNPLKENAEKEDPNELDDVELHFSKDLTYKIRVNDKVLNTRNNYKTLALAHRKAMEQKFYDKAELQDDDEELCSPYVADDTPKGGEATPIFNGNMGIVKSITKKEMIIDFATIGEVIVPKSHWKFIELGYAITCHKKQGDQSKIIIIGMDYSSYNMLTKEWIYTALTRAQKYCVLCAESSALRYAVYQNAVSSKKTHLAGLLRKQELEFQDSLIKLKELTENKKLEF